MFRLPKLLLLTLSACLVLAWSARADTYAQWAARVFTAQEQANPNISGETATPANDGVSNLLKFAFDLDPHKNGSAGLPTVGTVLGYDTTYPYPQIPFESLTWRYPYNYSVYNTLYFVPELSVDLHTWVRGNNVLSSPSYQYPQNAGDPYLFTVHALSPMSMNQRMFMRLTVLDGRFLPTSYQLAIWGHTGVDPEGDEDLDGIKNFDEYLAGSDPKDYYNGQAPYLLQVASGGNQRGAQGTTLPIPLAVRVESYGRQNAPLTFKVLQGGALLSTTNVSGASTTATVDLRATTPFPDAYGNMTYAAQVYVHLPATPNTDSVIQATATSSSSGQSLSITTVESTSNPNLQPPTDFSATATSPTTADLSWTPSDATLPTTAEVSEDGGATWKTKQTFAPGDSSATLTQLATGQTIQLRLYTGGIYDPNANTNNAAGGGTTNQTNAAGGGGGASTPTPPATVTPLDEYAGPAQFYSEQVGYNGIRRQFEGFKPDPQHPNPPTRYLTKKVVDTSDEAGPPDGVQDGGTTTTITKTDKKTGEQTTTVTKDGDGGEDYGGTENITSDSSKTRHGTDTDGSGEQSDVTTTLMDLYAADTFVSDVEGWVPPFKGKQDGSTNFASIKLSLPDKLTYDIYKLQYKWKANVNPFSCALWDVQFVPDDGGALKDDFQRWTTTGTPNPQGQAESGVYTIDPTTLNNKQNGTYTVIPVYAQLDSENGYNRPKNFSVEVPRDPNRQRPKPSYLTPAKLESWVQTLDSLVVFYDSTFGDYTNGHIPSDFDVTLTSTLQDDGVKWTKVKGPNTGNFQGGDTYSATLSNPKEGGFWQFDNNLKDKAKIRTQLLLPLAGAEILPWLMTELPSVGAWANSAKAYVDAQFVKDYPTLSYIPGAHASYVAGAFIAFSNRFDYILDPINSDSTAPCDAFKPQSPSYITVNGVVIHASKLNNMLWSLWCHYWGYSTASLKLGADANQLFGRFALDNASSQSAIDMGGNIYNELQDGGGGISSVIINDLQAERLFQLRDPQSLIEAKLWPCQQTYDPSKSTLARPAIP